LQSPVAKPVLNDAVCPLKVRMSRNNHRATRIPAPAINVPDAVRCTQDCRTSGVPQILTLYTTPVIYLLIDRLRRRSEPAALVAPAE
jgi:hypothetical protein